MGWLTKTASKRTADCSFCRRNYARVGALVEGPDGVFICGDCAGVSRGIIEQERAGRGVTVRPFLVPGVAYRFETDAVATAGVLLARTEDHWVQLAPAGAGRDGATWVNVHTVTEVPGA